MRQHSFNFAPSQRNRSRNLLAKALALWAFRGLSRGVANLFIPMGNLMNTGSTHIVHSHRVNPHFPSLSACFFFFFFFSLFDTRLDHQRAKCSKYPNYNHKYRTNPFNIAGSSQPRFINAFGILKTNILLMRRRQPIKVAKPSLFFLTS